VRDLRFPGDEAVYHALNGLRWPWLDAVMVFASSREFGYTAALLLTVWLFGSLRRRALRPVLQAAVALTIADRVGHELLKPLIGRIRPCYCLPAGSFRKLVDVGNFGSLPSLHSANAFAVAMAVTLCWPYAGRFVFPLAALIAISRVFVGVHWPSDVVAGALFGCLVAVLVHLAVAGVKRVRTPRPAVPQR